MKGAHGEQLSGSITHTVKAFMPDNVFSNHPVSMQMTVSQDHESLVQNFLDLTLFLVSNNFFGPTEGSVKKVNATDYRVE